ncbi:hypothetical protein RZN05_05710 [Sphingomonas sp. HF-S4]|uniref:DUF1963 domain-containing protein n=1 Tax=Sphingomonas agrestis TaxID=3080540 RepID=A0ABU3Y5J8_9SPHN|nr:hypothetical protein [Sphingomonas sp. HF-S4]MDV3456472.1 hypothetical protein [Sphingomonas sp. HF-S4]
MMHAYDIDVGPWRTGNPDRGEDGWCYGLPPGIAPEQWPLDPVTGHPLVHGFTLLLPEDYRVHGPEIVALSFFATPVDGNDGGASVWNDAVAALIDAPGDTAPDDPVLSAWWQRARQAHPRLHRMRDILDYAYAAVLLTRAEYEGPPCAPPAPIADPSHDAAAPAWLSEGAAPAFERFSGRTPFRDPAEPWSIHCPLRLIARADDPNAGLAPQETWGNEDAANGYRSPYYTAPDGEWREQPWLKDHAPNHLGGTMRPIQGVPEFSPYYIEFEEALGGYNFGGGNAQLDIRELEFDWACG